MRRVRVLRPLDVALTVAARSGLVRAILGAKPLHRTPCFQQGAVDGKCRRSAAALQTGTGFKARSQVEFEGAYRVITIDSRTHDNDAVGRLYFEDGLRHIAMNIQIDNPDLSKIDITNDR